MPTHPSSRRRGRATTAAVLHAALVGLAACDAAAPPLAPDAPTPRALADRAAVERPWRGRCDVTGTFTGPTSQVLVGTCELAHLGRVTLVTREELVFGPVITFTNATTYTAADGGELHTTGAGTAAFGADGDIAIAGQLTVVGGTGRFAGASGAATLHGTARLTGPASGEGSYALDGRLAY
jgi:hypothetical protein